ncbi:MAG: hypothetical protein E7252_09465, partial [Lachnospira sp.]|nr:hypothetical protein [Lachnospira sp.]
MRGKFNVKNLIKIIAVVGAIVAIIFSVRYSRKTEEKISQTNNLETTYDGYQRGSWSASVSKSYGGIGPFTVDSYKGGFCMTQGIDIVPKSQSLSLSYSNASVWNIVPNVYGNDSQELEFFRAKYRAAGGSAGNIFYTAQLVIWGFSSDTGLSRYTSSDGNVWADSSSAQITIQNGNQWVVGPFQLYNPSREFLQLNKGSLYLYENNSGSSISSFQIVDAYGYDVTGYSSSVDGWSGSFYFVFNHEYRKGVRYRVVGYYNSVVSYQSQGYIFTGRGNYQPMGFPVRQRYDRDIDVDVSIYENPSKYNMYIVKDGENSQHLPGAEFEMTKQGSSASFYTQGSSKIVTSSEQSPIYNTISGGTYLELTDTTPDIYTINETKAPLGYALLANPITLQINKRQIGDAYEIDSISIKYGDKEVTEIADSNGNQNKWFAIDKDGNAIVLGDEAKYGNGPTDEDNYWIAIQFHRAAGDSYTSAFAIKYRDPRAKYNLEIEKRDEIAGNKMAGAKFNLAINGNQKEIISKNDGEDNEVIEILADNTKEMSEPELIEITEIEAPSGYLLLKKPIIFRAYKTTNVNDEGRIDIEKLQLMKSATEETNTYITEGNSINIDKNGNVNDNNKVANISYSKGKIVVKIYDELRTGSYIVSFGKKKISDLNGYIAGVTYDYTSKINGTQNSTVEKVTGSAPIPLASVSISNENDARQIDEFKLEEKDVGDNDIKLKNYSASIFVHKKISDDGDRYEVDYVAYKDTKSNEEIKITIGQKLWIFKDGDYTNEDPDENRKKDLVAYIDYTDSREIVFVDIDEEKKPFEFNLYKTNDSNESLPNTYFRVVKHEVDGDIDLTQPITESGDLLLGFRSGEGEQLEDDNLIDNVPNRENFPHAYIYEIHETDATNGYVNVFKKDGQEIAYIQVKVYEDEDGNLKT